MFDNIKADIGRCNRRSEVLMNPAVWAVLSYRFHRWTYKSDLPKLIRIPVRLVSAGLDLIVRAVLHVELPAQADIGPGLYIPHAGYIVVGTWAQIGKNCTLAHGVTVGHGRGGKTRDSDVPSIGNRVYVGPGAILMGPIEVGDDALVGAGAVVVRSVPAAGVVAGNPGRILSRNGSFDLISYPNMESDPARLAALASFRQSQSPGRSLRDVASTEGGHRL
jgi:serine O-acetyltransferase